MTPAPPAQPALELTEEQRKARRKALLGTGIGNALEWFDWNVYASFSVFIAAKLFSDKDPASAFLSTLAIFAVGFIARPFGGYLFGRLADRKGRKFSMMLAVALASLGSLLIGIAPTFEAIGVFASLILLLARLTHGLAHGGELPSAQTYLAEAAPREKRGLWSSLIYVSGTAGLLFGLVLGVILNATLTTEQMDTFGWRIPFIIGALLGVYALYMRSGMEESEVFEKITEDAAGAVAAVKPSTWSVIKKYRRPALQVIGITVGFTVSYYAWAVNAPAHAIAALGMDRGDAFWSGIIGNLVLIAALPLWGMLSDRVGRKPVMLVAGLSIAVLSIPMTTWLSGSGETPSIAKLAIVLSVMSFFLAGLASIAPAIYAELFPTKVRATGMGLPYSICIAIFGGTAPYLQAWMGDNIASPNAFPIYTIVLAVVSAIVVLTLPETRGKDLND